MNWVRGLVLASATVPLLAAAAPVCRDGVPRPPAAWLAGVEGPKAAAKGLNFHNPAGGWPKTSDEAKPLPLQLLGCDDLLRAKTWGDTPEKS